MHRILTATMIVMMASNAVIAQERLLSREVVEPVMKRADCDVPVQQALDGQNVDVLDAGYKLVEVYCWRAAYNFGSLYFIVDAHDPNAAHAVEFKVWSGKHFNPSPTLSNPQYDVKTKTLGGFHKGRGVGDCGYISEWTWEGANFKMTGYWSKPNCDGEPFENIEDREPWRIFPRRK